MRKLTISFDGDEDLIESFMSWLDNQGEQDYWVYAECQGEGSDTISTFEYDYKNKTVVGKRDN